MQLGEDFPAVLKQIEETTGITEQVIVSSIEAAMLSAYKKFKSGGHQIEVHVDAQKSELLIYEVYSVVETVANRDAQITVEEANVRCAEAEKRMQDCLASKKRHDQAELEERTAEAYRNKSVGDTIKVEVWPKNFGRIAAQTARQVIIQKLKDAERQIVYEQFANKIGNIVTGTIVRQEGEQVLVRLNDKTEAIMPKEERVSGEKYLPDVRMRFYLLEVRQTSRGPRIVVSRSHPNLLRRLLEVEIPEIHEGVVEIRGLVREAGSRSKVAVATLDVNVEPVGACLGKQGSRIKAVSTELSGERVDIVPFNHDALKYIVGAISPAKAVKIEPVLDADKSAIVYVRSDQLSLAIGKAGQNVRLAARLTGWKIDIKVKDAEQMPTMKDLFIDGAGDKQEEAAEKKQAALPTLGDLFKEQE